MPTGYPKSGKRRPRKKETRRRNRDYTGANNPRWLGGERSKVCGHCGETFHHTPPNTYAAFRKQKFCSKPCADRGGLRYYGKDNPRYREDARRRNRTGPYRRWVSAVLNRDEGKCRRCGRSNVQLHAHHVRPWRDHPELRFDVTNGETLCYDCHWAEHTALNENAVKSVDARPDGAEGNTEPSERGNLLDGVTTRGRPFRKWLGRCDWCDVVIVKVPSDVRGKAALFCSGSCRSRWIRAKHGPIRKGGNSSTSAAPERDDIV